MATLSEVFTNIANAIRSKTGKTEAMTPAEMVTEIEALEAGSGEGSGGIVADVCNILIPEYADKLLSINYVKCENGACAQTTVTPDTSNFTITNVLCNSLIYIYYQPTYTPFASYGVNLEEMGFYSNNAFIKLTALPGGTAELPVFYNDF